MLLSCLYDDNPKATKAYEELSSIYEFVPLNRRKGGPKAIVVLGGDGFMLQCLHKYYKKKLPFYGMNRGTMGFLMNEYRPDDLLERIKACRPALLYPLQMYAQKVNGKTSQAIAFNEVSLFRESRQAAKIRVTVDHIVRLNELVCDGVLATTAAGSTAYNFSVGGPIIPFGANVIGLTPLAPFRPRRWRGALLPHSATINFDILEPKKRPVSAVADFTEVRDVTNVAISEQRKLGVQLLFDPDRALEERTIREQFSD